MSALMTSAEPTTPRPLDRLLYAAEYATGAVPDLGSARLTDPGALAEALRQSLGARVIVTGTLDRRLVFVENVGRAGWTVADLSGASHVSREWPSWADDAVTLDRPSSWLSEAHITPAGLYRLTHPRLLLAALYHPEYFPLPRFPLGISDLARAARAMLLGHVELMDMQLGVRLGDIVERIEADRPDIVGVSATFGQHDLMLSLLDRIASGEGGPLVVAGGSLTARNERLLLDRHPDLLVARGAGETTIADVLAHWQGDLDRDQVRGIGYRGAARGEGTLTIGRAHRTATVANRARPDIWPELDLLPRTFEHQGVAQLETSRGCTNFCSFCPRGHKGSWAGAAPDALGWVLDAFAEVFDERPDISRTLYLVDEEFIGRGEGAVPRALAVADMLHARRLAWETSCRVDQVIRLDRDRAWHIERGQMWRGLIERGLRRCLFGVESGVTSILDRFNKETSAEQNALAVRTLSALGVPTRFTYITFDHLMNAEELHATYAFQGRTDLILRPLPHLSVAEIIDGVHDEAFVSEHATGQPFHEAISYMLVSMECLIGAAYTRAVEAAGLTDHVRPSMGRVDARFLDWRIGVLSHRAQLWVDRNFALDYTLKSLEKLADGDRRRAIRDTRVILKRAGYDLLGGMLALLDRTTPDTPHRDGLDEACAEFADTLVTRLRGHVDDAVTDLACTLPPAEAGVLLAEHAHWDNTDTWHLINAADPCGT
ncbi:MAG: B12-binding domain-containing radical SAM protein [Streptomycetales bacterium]